MLLLSLLQAIGIILQVASTIIVVQAILSFMLAFNVISLSNDAFRAIWTSLDRLTEPLYRPIRRIMPDLGALDLSPLIVLVIIQILRGPVLGYFTYLAVSTM